MKAERAAEQVRERAAVAGVLLGGENALPCFVPGGVDQYALDRIVYNSKPWSPPLQVAASLPWSTSLVFGYGLPDLVVRSMVPFQH